MIHPLIKCIRHSAILGLLWLVILSPFYCSFPAFAVDTFTIWNAGFSKIDVTPSLPVRLSGYASRERPNEGIETPLYVRAIAIKHRNDGDTHLLISVDTIGLPGEFTRTLADLIRNELKLRRSQIVFSSTHTHCAPHLEQGLTNIFATPLNTVELQNAEAYREQLQAAIIQSARLAVANMAPATLEQGQGSVGFAANRRKLQNGRWVGFGVQADAPIDHSVPVLCIRDVQRRIQGVIFNYACHCTTLGGDYFRVHADWAGIATKHLEESNLGAVAICTIGCGADSNPLPCGEAIHAEQHGKSLAEEVQRVLHSNTKTISEPLFSNFDYAGLAFDLPSREELKARLSDPSIHIQRNAQHLLDVYQEHGRLPATYPVPIQTWKFGKQLSMVFLGGEVVVDYALRLKHELNDSNLWVSAYCNDVMGYVCSQRMRQEMGYEYKESGIYYNLPGPWANGTEDLFVRRIHEVLKSDAPESPLEPSDALKSIAVEEGYAVQLVAAEPLVEDPINIAFGPDGKLWVVEMGDYPNGGPDGKSLGKIKYLVDQDQDGNFDKAYVFVDEIAFPTGVQPWRDGVLISAAPNIIYAEDQDSDGKADKLTPLYTGFDLANPQHRINGFSYALDNSYHLASGDNLHEIKSLKTNEVVNVSGCDLQIEPSSGSLAVVSGRSQYVRSQNDWGEWFGSDNSRPMFHYPIDEHYLRRTSKLNVRSNMQQLFDPPSAPPVFPRSKTLERFNDLFASNRFTSACSAIVFRSNKLGDDRNGHVFVCEPVHNLVHEAMLVRDGASYKAERIASQKEAEFLASTDPWFRPVRVVEGSDGMLWVVDMYRQVIEHPEWIPLSWQEQLDLRAGADRGRIYRVVPKAEVDVDKPASLPNVSSKTTTELVSLLDHRVSAVRELAQQALLDRDDKAQVADELRKLVIEGSSQGKIHALWCLHTVDLLVVDDLMNSLKSSEPGVFKNALKIAEQLTFDSSQLDRLCNLALACNDPMVDLQLALSIGSFEAKDKESWTILGNSLIQLLHRDRIDPWLQDAILSSATRYTDPLLAACLDNPNGPNHNVSNRKSAMLDSLLKLGDRDKTGQAESLAVALRHAGDDVSRAMQLAVFCLNANLVDGDSDIQKSLHTELQRVYKMAVQRVTEQAVAPEQMLPSIQLLGRGFGSNDADKEILLSLLSPQVPIESQHAAIRQLIEFYDATAVDALLAKWPNLTEGVRQNLIDQIVRQSSRVNKLLDQIENGAIQANELNPATIQQLLQMGNQTMRVRTSRLLAIDENLDRRALIQTYATSLSTTPSREEGEKHFQRVCAACHVANSEGRSAGPNLKNLTDRSTQALLTSILDPNRAVDPQYRSYIVLLENGETITGAIAQESGNSIIMAQPNGKFATINRSEIEEIKNTNVSLMPEGIQRELDFQAMSDLLEYLK